MADHPRKQIRDAVVAMLSAQDGAGEYPTGAKARVYNSRDFPLDARIMPVCLVYTFNESLDSDYQHDGGVRRRIMDLRVEFYQAGDSAAADVDEGAFQVENIIHADPTLGNLVESCRLQSTDIAFAAEGDFALFTAVMVFEIVYYTHLIEDEGGRPVTVLLGFDPETGPGNEGKYIDTGEQVPPDIGALI